MAKEKTGHRIKQRREALNMSVDELAEKIGKSRATVYRYENEDIKDLPSTILEPLSIALETSPHYFMGWNSQINERQVNEMAKAKTLTAEEVEEEIEALRHSEYVRLARAEQRMKYKRRQALYTLRCLEKRGKELSELGLTINDFDEED